MRIRATTAAALVTGALALTGAVVPAAQAAGHPAAHADWRLARRARAERPAGGVRALDAHPGDGQPLPLDVTFSDVSADSGKKAVPVGISNTVHVPYGFTVTGQDAQMRQPDFYAGVDLYRGPADDPDNDLSGDDAPTCTLVSASSDGTDTVHCSGTVDIHPKTDLTLSDAGASWHAVVWAIAFNGQDPSDPDMSRVGYAEQTGHTAPTLQRYSKLTVNASPEPVTKGHTVTVVGKLSRANWDSHGYYGYTVQPVRLQFRKKTSDTYGTLKTVKTDGHGDLRTTSKATVDGYWRYSFAGTATTPAVSATGDYVDVR